MSGVASTKPAPSLEGLAELARLSADGSSEAIERILSLARAALDMDVALVGAFDGDFVVEAIDGDSEWFDLEVGTRIPADQTYCGRMTRGKLPHLIHDAARTSARPIFRSRARPASAPTSAHRSGSGTELSTARSAASAGPPSRP